jgi:hypothetical protein
VFKAGWTGTEDGENRYDTPPTDILLTLFRFLPQQARLSSFVGALALGDLVKSTLGPKGMNKILHSTSTGEITVTNDGATILKSIALDNPAAKILVNISKVQDDEVGDGASCRSLPVYKSDVFTRLFPQERLPSPSSLRRS